MPSIFLIVHSAPNPHLLFSSNSKLLSHMCLFYGGWHFYTHKLHLFPHTLHSLKCVLPVSWPLYLMAQSEFLCSEKKDGMHNNFCTPKRDTKTCIFQVLFFKIYLCRFLGVFFYSAVLACFCVSLLMKAC